ncbi:mannose-1-phosphate guanylyltransferase/mannose-6-phosphate isomerase [Vibrio parahaemolyticus]|uniref:mannose-1-phosphate guanylyltransferase/mannose-6-phosphate isomerase n=1 Tax=Vibrio parahaemolyticus TaxID=670 RepID=UPI0010DB23A8|nr:mannose-1-phosphate guanylyltransferase/mannose-6-phosphate isomerase [Vibrio parahaemolyticus]ELA9322458.1 mannose-1-phosphate guanylyltransferase/mannose-6-phosphate isomerase [Vibrio parahaemolyticus]ELB2241473.1 mannose-1-phosphate guanylyltransferase/mannose-6-phosphate isomerase [Vibrio parahaemolyticus]MBM5098090.1 mannose-1-phosphate guanylyltransferase/mannose-6-phosphate isomerase [Vibrio parahaemolyticus]MBM5101983.1 mannose-1-phosphate guanylyltransferase/mannose-6-phosphate isom
MTITPVIMAGGTGSRLWPMSRALHPKQFLRLTSEYSMLQETALRVGGVTQQNNIVICNEDHRFLAAEQLREIDRLGNIILEPVGKNTAPAIALAAFQLSQTDPEALMLVLAADHVIQDRLAFEKSVLAAQLAAEKGKMVTFGIVPTHAETGYGYIRRGGKVDEGFEVEQFVEKPSKEFALQYVEAGDYYWNSGMFMFKASRYLEELKLHRPDIYSVCEQAMKTTTGDLDFTRISEDIFNECPSDSIDYAVMEKTQDAVVIPLDAQWSDVGAWSALWDISEKDSAGNVLKGDVIVHNSTSSYFNAEQKMIAAVGVDNLVVIETKDAVLVANKDQVQDVKEIVEHLKSNGRTEHHIHREVYRPWGKYDSIDYGERDQVKRITVNPGEKLSIQMHHHRSEHWIVVAGTAKVTNGEQTILVSEDQSTYIPLGTIHALENPGKIPLEMIEVQTGSYLGEDDIVRFEDRYGRS